MNAAQTRAMESDAIACGQASARGLMASAGAAVMAAILEAWPEFRDARPHDPRRAIVLCGPGNNGGDGFVIARHLAEHGWRVRVLFCGEAARLSPEARAAHDAWCRLAEAHPVDLADPGPVEGAELLVDALFGFGLSRPVTEHQPLLTALGRARDEGRITASVAVDLPSGLCTDSGRALVAPGGRLIPADLTVSFHSLKPGHLLADGPALCGWVVVADLGLALPATAIRRSLWRGRPAALHLAKAPGAHKYDHGHAVVVAGAPGAGGAARLAARAALRVGAGLVTLAPPDAAMPEHARPPDALMRRPVDDATALAEWLSDGRIRALCLGPGCGIARAEALLPAALDWGGTLVLDADAITALASRAELRAKLHPGCVLTPHGGEFARLCPDLATRLTDPTAPLSRLEAARQAARVLGATILLKGPDTIIATHDQAIIHSRLDLGWLATAGAGDVLAGLITGLLARGRPAADACEAAVLLHAEAAHRIGPGLIADDLPEALPAILRDLEG
ncbi:NAD(P)H-hydrate dehydratase [Paracoccus sp. NSM]|uniref:NAD(P)H-hydrate dehydratase n=1 Tax=Paracoccus sp. NSM TaxID=3457784 RepID=UPI004035D879